MPPAVAGLPLGQPSPKEAEARGMQTVSPLEPTQSHLLPMPRLRHWTWKGGAEEIMQLPTLAQPLFCDKLVLHNLSCPDWNHLSVHTLAHIQCQPPPAGNGCLKELPTSQPQPHTGATCLRWLSRSPMLAQRMADPGLQLDPPPAPAHGRRVGGTETGNQSAWARLAKWGREEASALPWDPSANHGKPLLLLEGYN